ncbi:hypothetical protein [uncultured Clostridium sp.]|jgi:hypothetical protein|nr:hypothetical protein [uncultured Clostridium sp.]
MQLPGDIKEKALYTMYRVDGISTLTNGYSAILLTRLIIGYI